MTESEAIEAIQFDLKIGGEIHSQVLRDAVGVAIQALEKHIAKKPMRIERSAMGWEYKDYYCPCGKFIGAEPHIKSILEKGGIPVKYCDDCGQRLDFKEG
jgi:hypothetical protein